MNKYKKKYQRIVDDLIKKSFPELKEKKVKIVEFPKFFVFWSFAQKGFGRYYIFINKKRRNANVKSLKAQLAHELCHIVLDHMDKTVFGDLYHNFRKFLSIGFNTKFSRRIETKVDKEVIRRGYARELYSSDLDWEKTFSERIVKGLYARGYLSPEQIESYAKKIGKW